MVTEVLSNTIVVLFNQKNVHRLCNQRPENRQEELRRRAQQLLEDAKKQSRNSTQLYMMSTSVSDQQLTEVRYYIVKECVYC